MDDKWKLGLAAAGGLVVGWFFGAPAPTAPTQPAPSPRAEPLPAMPVDLEQFVLANESARVPLYWAQMALWSMGATNALPSIQRIELDALREDAFGEETTRALKLVDDSRNWGLDKPGDAVVLYQAAARTANRRSPPWRESDRLLRSLNEFAASVVGESQRA